MSDKELFLRTIVEAKEKARTSGNMQRVYQSGKSYLITPAYHSWQKWLFVAYPGGRCILSVEGNDIANREPADGDE